MKQETIKQILFRKPDWLLNARIHDALCRTDSYKLVSAIGYKFPIKYANDNGVVGICFARNASINEAIGDSIYLKQLSRQIDCPVFVALYGSKPDDDTKVYDSSFNLVKTIKKG